MTINFYLSNISNSSLLLGIYLNEYNIIDCKVLSPCSSVIQCGRVNTLGVGGCVCVCRFGTRLRKSVCCSSSYIVGEPRWSYRIQKALNTFHAHTHTHYTQAVCLIRRYCAKVFTVTVTDAKLTEQDKKLLVVSSLLSGTAMYNIYIGDCSGGGMSFAV